MSVVHPGQHVRFVRNGRSLHGNVTRTTEHHAWIRITGTDAHLIVRQGTAQPVYRDGHDVPESHCQRCTAGTDPT